MDKMNIGYLYITAYILLLGIGTFLQEHSLKFLTAFQLEFLIGISMIIITPLILFVVQKNVKIPIQDIGIGLLVGVLFVIGSLAFTLSLTKLPVGVSTALSLLYLVVVLILSISFHYESLSLSKIFGIAFMLIGAFLLVLGKY